jgi:hypothetical protein
MNPLRYSPLLCRAAVSFVRNHPPAWLCGASVNMHRLRGLAVTRGALRPVRPDSSLIVQQK